MRTATAPSTISVLASSPIMARLSYHKPRAPAMEFLTETGAVPGVSRLRAPAVRKRRFVDLPARPTYLQTVKKPFKTGPFRGE